MSQTKRTLAPGIHDNHGLKLWHEWQALIARSPRLASEWRYERDDDRVSLAGPGEILTRSVGNLRFTVLLGGDGHYTPGVTMIDTHGAQTSGPGRVKTAVSPPRSGTLFEALASAEEAAGEIGQPLPPASRRKRS